MTDFDWFDIVIGPCVTFICSFSVDWHVYLLFFDGKETNIYL
jgi:hypothetical protein